MIKGLLWLPLLFTFIWLAWQGWNEYQKVEIYQTWSQNFDKAKFDIYAVLGLKDDLLTWGIPTRKGIINLQSFSLKNVDKISLLIDNKSYDLNTTINTGNQIYLEFNFKNNTDFVKIPFTQINLAIQWGNYLQLKVDNAQLITD